MITLLLPVIAREAVHHPGTQPQESERYCEAFPYPRGIAVVGDGRADSAAGRALYLGLARANRSFDAHCRNLRSSAGAHKAIDSVLACSK